MKLDNIDLASLKFIHSSFKKALFKEINGSGALALARGFLVLDDIIKDQEKPLTESFGAPVMVVDPIKAEETKKKGRPKKHG